MARTYTFTETEVQLLHELVNGSLQAHKNWLVGAVEREDFERAKALVGEIKVLTDLFAKTNVEAHKFVDAAWPR